jgi:hypothetical protein
MAGLTDAQLKELKAWKAKDPIAGILMLRDASRARKHLTKPPEPHAGPR